MPGMDIRQFTTIGFFTAETAEAFRRKLVQALIDAGYALAAADTSGNYSVGLFAAAHFVEQLDGKFSPGATQGMAESNSAAVYIYDVRV